MEFITTKRGARAIVYEGHMYWIEEDEMDVSSGGVGETGAAVGLFVLLKMR